MTFNEEVTRSLGVSSVLDESCISFGVLLEVFLGVGFSSSSGSFSVCLGLDSSVLDSGGEFLISGLLFEDVFWDDSSLKDNRN